MEEFRMDITGITFLGRSLMSYVWVAVIAVCAVVIRSVLLRIVRKLTRSAKESDFSNRYAVLDRVIRRLVIPSSYLGTVLAAGAILDIGETAQKLVRDVLIGLIIFFAIRLANSVIAGPDRPSRAFRTRAASKMAKMYRRSSIPAPAAQAANHCSGIMG
jgi:hypothetical protein